MTVKELKRQQLQELKQKYYDDKLQEQENRSISYGEMANIDEIVTDDEIIKEFDGYMFTDEDFSPVENEKDNIINELEKWAKENNVNDRDIYGYEMEDTKIIYLDDFLEKLQEVKGAE